MQQLAVFADVASSVVVVIVEVEGSRLYLDFLVSSRPVKFKVHENDLR